MSLQLGLLAFEIEAHCSEIDGLLTGTIQIEVRLLTLIGIGPGQMSPAFAGNSNERRSS